MSKKIIKVSISSQRLSAYEGNTMFHECPCITGSEGHETTIGTHTIFKKAHPYRSKAYDAQMDYAMFFTSDGQALHKFHGPFDLVRASRKLLGPKYVGSHGCVRLRETDAQKLYDWVPAPGKERVTVIISAS